MPKKKQNESASEQSARFQKEVERLIAAGELSHTEAVSALDTLFSSKKITKPKK